MGIGIGISYFGLFHKKDIILVSSVMRQNTCKQNVSSSLPAYMTGGPTMYLGELQDPTGCFLKNMHKGAKRNQNMGKSVLAKWPKMVTKMIKVDPTCFIGTCWHRSGAAAMANQGESTINLKRAGGWQSKKVVQGYITQSKHIKTAQVGALEGMETPILGP
eukprot:8296270-Ditylum_brightwellii.AAC.1